MDDLQKQFQKLQTRLRRARQKVYACQGTNDDPGTDFLLPHNSTGTNNLNTHGGCIQHSNTDVRNTITMPLEEATAGIMPEYCCLPEDNPVTSNHIESASPLKSGTETSFGSPDVEKVGYTFAFNDEAERSDMIEDDPANHRSVDDVTTYVPNYDVPDWCFLESPQMCYPTTPARDPPEYHEAIRLKQVAMLYSK